MFSVDCAGCPAGPRGCEGCIVDFLFSENAQVDRLSEESCGYVLEPDVRAAIGVLLDVGMLTDVEILAKNSAA